MAREVKKAPVRKKRARRRPRVETVYYVVAIEDWDWSLWFGVSNMPEREGPYDDYRHLNLRGTLQRPSKLKCDAVELHFLPDKRLNEGERERHQPVSIGHLNLRSGQMYGVMSMPADALPLLLTMATAEKLRYVVMHGEKFRYGNANLKSFRVEMNIDEDDLPAEE
jgi:hypothetical protein